MKKKIRVNITIDSELLEKARKKLGMFGGKLSTLFNAYLSDFVKSLEQNHVKKQEDLSKRYKELEKRLKRIEKSFRKKKYSF